MRTYKVTVSTGCHRRAHVSVRTSAKTDTGLARAIGTQIAKSLKTDVFEVVGMIWREGVARDYNISDWHHTNPWPIEHMIWKAAHDTIMDGMMV